MKWKDKLINDIIIALRDDPEWDSILNSVLNVASIHLAIFNEPYLSLMLVGKKTIESRFSINKVIPFQRVYPNDLVLVKKAGGPIVGIFCVESVNFYSNLNANKVASLDQELGHLIGWNEDPEFLSNKSGARFLTLIGIGKIKKLSPLATSKADRTGWSILKLGYKNTLFDK